MVYQLDKEYWLVVICRTHIVLKWGSEKRELDGKRRRCTRGWQRLCHVWHNEFANKTTIKYEKKNNEYAAVCKIHYVVKITCIKKKAANE